MITLSAQLDVEACQNYSLGLEVLLALEQENVRLRRWTNVSAWRSVDVRDSPCRM